MSSATSTSERVGLKPDASGAARAGAKPADHAFRASHFFVLASLVAATGAVIVSRQSTPEHLVLISATIASAGLAAAGFYRVLSPLVGPADATVYEPLSDRARAVLERDKLHVLRAIKDLEFDRSMGKVSPADFDEMMGRLRARALLLMQQLDEDGAGYRSVIEQEVAKRLAAVPTHAVAVEAPEAPAPVAGLCGCGTTNDADALFCKRCGQRLGGSISAADR